MNEHPIGNRAKVQMHDPDARFIPPGGWPLVSGTLTAKAGAWDRMQSYVLSLDRPLPKGFDPWHSLPKSFAKAEIRRILLIPFGKRALGDAVRDMVKESFEIEQPIQVLIYAMLDSDSVPAEITAKVENLYKDRAMASGRFDPIHG